MVIGKILLSAALTVLFAFPGCGPGTETEAAVLPAPAGIAAELMKTDEERETEPAEEEPKANLKGYVESDREKEIYSYLQVPEVYSNDPDWSGGWTYIEAGGQMFFYFGC